MEARNVPVLGRGKKSPLCDPGSELLLGGSARESSERIIYSILLEVLLEIRGKKPKKLHTAGLHFRLCTSFFSPPPLFVHLEENKWDKKQDKTLRDSSYYD